MQNHSDDPYFNLALEEYLLREADHESVMLWQSRPSVVIGKHQNALGEVNYPYVSKNGIPVIRRLSGGGAVFHSRGNINFTFVLNGEEGKLVDFRKHTAPVIDFLVSLGIPARFEGKNDIRINGLKVSGNAEHVFRRRVLHHGTLLYDADLSVLNDSIRVTPERYIDKSVASVRSQVANVSNFLENPPSLVEFQTLFSRWLKDYFRPLSGVRELSAAEIERVQALANEKYAQWHWNYGYSPDYEFYGEASYLDQHLVSVLKVEKGYIRRAEIRVPGGEAHPYAGAARSWKQLEGTLSGCRHAEPEIVTMLKRYQLLDGRSKALPPLLSGLFF
ncbi:MAG: biotin/lipoate A/B protein ligase family protein [Bacteroidales bacterium]